MTVTDLPGQVETALETDRETFADRVAEEAARLKTYLREGTFDNPQAIVGLEYELYGVEDEGVNLRRVPRNLLDLVGFEAELGLHNAELHTTPQPLSEHGLAAQQSELRARLEAARDATTRAEGIRFVSDSMWTVPPRGESATGYLTDSVEYDGVRIATNMSESPRYHAMANSESVARMELDAPHLSLSADTVMPESLITSIQPHYQVPHAPDLPEYFRYALRVAGPLLALGVNSPFYPPDLYDEEATVEEILEDGHDEHRIGVFESVLNPTDGASKVRFPADVETVEEAVDRVADDEAIVPMDVEASGRFDDAFAHFRHKHGSFWRWVRPVFDGATESAANARIEFRPLPAQPTVRDSVAFLATFAGLMKGLVHREHPVRTLDWETARENFYAAARDGLDADLTWVTADGTRTTNTGELYADLFAYARDGLQLRGLSAAGAVQYVRPLRRRVDQRTTPADWKRDRVRDAAASGADLEAAVTEMQREYVERQDETFLTGAFADWLAHPSAG